MLIVNNEYFASLSCKSNNPSAEEFLMKVLDASFFDSSFKVSRRENKGYINFSIFKEVVE